MGVCFCVEGVAPSMIGVKEARGTDRTDRIDPDGSDRRPSKGGPRGGPDGSDRSGRVGPEARGEARERGYFD